jgi:RNA polymerase sigma-70 factor (ECF subfamily)
MFPPQPDISYVHRRDTAIVERLRQRDPAALAELYDAYSRSVYSLLIGIVKDKAIAEDLAQETFLRVWLRAGLFDSRKGSAGPWVLTIARNQALDYLRSRNIRRCSDGAHLAETEDPRLFSNLERDIRLSHSRPLLNSALDELTPHQLTAIDLAYFEGCTQSEIAERMGHPLGTVKTWVRTALGTLRDRFRQLDRSPQTASKETNEVAINVYTSESEGI